MQQQILFRSIFGTRSLALLLGISVSLMAHSASAGTSSSSVSKANPPSTEGEESVEEEEPIGILLGEFFIRDKHDLENAKTRISFSLYAAVAPEDEKAFATLLARHQSRVRDLVLTAIRLSDNHDFQEASLDRLKWRMLLRLRRGLPQLKIEHLHFRRFVFFID